LLAELTAPFTHPTLGQFVSLTRAVLTTFPLNFTIHLLTLGALATGHPIDPSIGMHFAAPRDDRLPMIDVGLGTLPDTDVVDHHAIESVSK
jgi:hypothetical protein